MKFDMNQINREIGTEEDPLLEEVDESSIFAFDCPFCGVADQRWLDLGNETSKCLQCRVIGTNSGYEKCPMCDQEDFVYTINKISKCFVCWNHD